MSEHAPYMTTTLPAVKVTYTDDSPDVREYLIDLRHYFLNKEKDAINLQRDLHRKVRDLDELIARMSPDKPPA